MKSSHAASLGGHVWYIMSSNLSTKSYHPYCNAIVLLTFDNTLLSIKFVEQIIDAILYSMNKQLIYDTLNKIILI